MSAALGMVIYASVKPIFKIYLIIIMGFVLARLNILSVTTCRDISDAVVSAIMPCLIFNNIVTNLKSSDIKNLGIIAFEATLLFLIGGLLGLLTYIICKPPRKWLGGLISVGIFPNISDLPIAYLQTLTKTGGLFTTEDGNKGVAYVCIFLAAQIFYQFSLGLFRLIAMDFKEDLNKDTNPDNKDEEQAIDTDELKHLDNPPQRYNKKEAAEPTETDSSSFSRQETGTKHTLSAEDQHDNFLVARELNTAPSDQRSSLSSDQSLPETFDERPETRGSMATRYYSVSTGNSRHLDLRQTRSQDIHDVIHEYSEFSRIRSNEVKSVVSASGEGAATPVKPTFTSPDEGPISKRQKVIRTAMNVLRNFRAPNSVSLIVSLAIAMSPPLKALFVHSHFHLPDAPDKQPPLSFILDLASYVGAASVPLGLLLLGATIARLQVNQMVPGFWKTAIMITICRLVILPIFGVGLTTGLQNAGWFGEDKLVRFISVLEFALPSATVLVYLTAFYSDPTSPHHTQMDCLAVCIIAQYAILFISLPILVVFSLKVSMHY